MLKVLSRLAPVLCIFILGCAAPAPDPGPPVVLPPQPPAGQLADEVEPISYELQLHIDPRQARFSGHTRIEIEVRRTIDGIWLHGRDLNVTSATLSQNGVQRSLSWKQYTDEGSARLSDANSIGPGRATLDIRYDAVFDTGLDGLYKVVEEGKDYAFTQFEAIAARKAFPSFDEPRFKTPFRVSLTVPEGMKAVANTPVVSDLAVENAQVRYTFQTTPPLPSYLIAFAVGPLDIVDTLGVPPNYVRTRQLPLRGVAAAGKGLQLDYALLHTGALLGLMEDYFALPYPYSKLDIIAVPDFAAGAMENPGAITFRESLLLLNQDSPIKQRRRYAMVMAHELAHMWFGDLVTMPWWNDIWLNEAFATWMATKTVMRWDPEQKAELTALERMRAAMREDALQSSRTIRQPVYADRDIRSAFDGITYRKGGGVLNMVEAFLGEKVFRAGIRDYLRTHAEGNATSEDLVAALSRAARQDLAPIFDSFLNQQGIPFVEAHLSCVNGSATVRLSQRRYTLPGSKLNPDGNWNIPVCTRFDGTRNAHRQCFLLQEPQQDFALETRSCPKWLVPNADYNGYYHWSVSDSEYKALFDAQADLTTLDTMTLADSVLAAFEAGSTPLSDSFERLRALAGSDRPQVSASARGPVEFLADYVANGASSQEWLRSFADALYRRSPADRIFDARYMHSVGDDSQRLFLTEIAEFRALHAGDTDLIDKAVEATFGWLNATHDQRNRMLHPDVLPVAFNLAARSNDPKLYDALLSEFKSNRDALQRGILLDGLALFSQPDLARRTRDLVFDKDLRRNEVMSLLLVHIKIAENRADAWRWLVDNFDKIAPQIPPQHAAALSRIGERFCSTEHAAALQAFLGDKASQFPGGDRTLAKTIESVDLCAARAAHYRSEMPAFALNSESE